MRPLLLALPLALAACAPSLTPSPSLPPEPLTLSPTHRRNVAIVLYPGVELLDFAGPGEVFAANHAFRVYTVAETRAPIVSQRFVTVTPQYGLADAPKPDIVVLPGGDVRALRASAPMKEWLQRQLAEDELVTSVCNGALALADVGALDGHRATTHWSAVESLRRRAPRAVVAPDDRYVDEGRVMTTAGVSAGIDGALHLVKRFAGEESAWETARYMQYPWSPEDAAIPGRAPLSPARRAAMRAWVMHEWQTAATAYASIVQRSPGDGHARARLGDALVHLGKRDEGLAELAQAMALGLRDPETLNEYALALLELHRMPEAAAAFQALAEASEGARPSAYYNQACVLAGAGDARGALDALGRAIAAGFHDAWSLEHDEDLASLRNDPRFVVLVAAARAG